MLFNVFLFITFFCFYCCLIPTQSREAQDSLDSFIPSLKEAFSSDFDPMPDTIENPTNSTQNPSFSPSQAQRYNQDNPIPNPVSTVTLNANLPAIPESLTYKELKEFIKVHNLQATVKHICGKPYNRCQKKELIQALKA